VIFIVLASPGRDFGLSSISLFPASAKIESLAAPGDSKTLLGLVEQEIIELCFQLQLPLVRLIRALSFALIDVEESGTDGLDRRGPSGQNAAILCP